MLEVLTKHLENSNDGCVVANWIASLEQDEQKAFALLKEKSTTIKVSQLFTDLNKQIPLPFKLTAFRSHLRGYCTCR